MTSVVDRVDHLVTQYVWSLENDGVFVDKAQQHIRAGRFDQFRQLCITNMRPIRKRFSGGSDGEGLAGWEWGYVYFTLWNRLGGYGKELTNPQSVTDWNLRVDALNEKGFSYTERGVVFTSTTNPCAEILISQPQPCVLAEPEKEIPVSKKIIIANVTFINNVDVTTMKEDQLIDAIKTIEAEIADLKAVKTKSAKIAAKIAEAQETLTKVVEILDSRP